MAVWLVPCVAAAQDPAFDMGVTDACLDAGGERDVCIGTAASKCMETPGGQSTVGMGYCLEQEWQVWDARLNSAYQQVMAAARATDAAMQELGSSAPSQATALRDMQRAWITFRDAKCDYERSLWGGGTGGGPATLACLLTETARQTLYLQVELE